ANAPPSGATPFAGFATSVGLRPPSVAHPATLLILIDALLSSCLPRSNPPSTVRPRLFRIFFRADYFPICFHDVTH
ncbi:MAG TPA: hypothetical protein VME41_01110, partial [Stellaceae bacterium]|nr:hypothetical protein [Stellaceae bacterium]